MNNLDIHLNDKQIKLITWVLLTLMTLIGMAVDLTGPSLPAISRSLQESPSIVQNTMSLYLIGYALGNFISGILTDAFGRRKLLLSGLLGFTLVSLSAAIINYIEMLLAMRLLQGLMLGAIAATLRGTLADILPAKKLLYLGTMVCMMWGVGAITGPIIGGYLQLHYGWQAGFYLFSIIGVLELITVFMLVPETYSKFHSLSMDIIKQDFNKFITNSHFIALSLLMGVSYAAIIIFNTAGPFLIQNTLHYSAIQFGKMALYLASVYIFATLLCRYLLTKFNAKKLLFAGLNVFLTITSLSIITNHFLANNIIFIIFVSSVMFFACGYIFALSLGLGISIFRHMAGSATATMYTISTIITSIAASLVSLINMQNSISLMWAYLILTVISVLIYLKYLHLAKLV